MSGKEFTYKVRADYEGKTNLQRMRQDIASLGKIDSLKKLGSGVRDVNQKFKEARARLAEQAKEMKVAGKASAGLVTNYKKTQREVKALAVQLERQKNKFREASESAKKAGVNTGQLASEEKRLTSVVNESKKVYAARQAFGVRSHREIRREIGELKNSYNDLRRSGKLTTVELHQAKMRLKQKVSELKVETNGWAGAITQAKTGLAGLAVVGYAFVRSFADYSNYSQKMAEVNTLLDVSQERFAALKGEVVAVSKEIPQLATNLAGAEYDIISAGANLEQSTEILRKSAKAAVAGVTDTKTAVNVGMGVLNAYGMEVDKLGGIYDTLFLTVKKGVTTFPELANNLGEILPTARASGVGIRDVSAAVAALTKAGIRTPQAATALKGAINAMAAPTPEAKRKFDELGITWKGLIPTLDQIREKGLTIDEMRFLIPDVEARTGVLALTQNFDELKGILSSMDEATGSMDEAYDKMKDTPQNQLVLLRNELTAVMYSMGNLVAMGLLPVIKGIRSFSSWVSTASPITKAFLVTLAAGATGFTLWKLGLGQIVLGLQGMVVQARAAIIANGGLTASLRGLNLAAKGGLVALAGLAGWEIGKLLNKFKVVRQAGVAMVAGLVKAGLRAKQAWRWITGGDLEEVKKEIAAADAEFAAMFHEIETGADQASKKVAGSLGKMTQDIQSTAEAGQKAAVSLSEAFKSISSDSTNASLDAFVAKLDQMVSTGQRSAQQLKTELKGLFNEMPMGKLEEFIAQAKERFSELSDSGTAASVTIEAALEVALEKLGVDVAKATTNVSTAAMAANDAFMLVAQSGQASADIIDAAFEAALKKMADPDEIKALEASLHELSESGAVSAQKLSEYFQAAGDRLQELEEKANKTTEKVDKLRESEADQLKSQVRSDRARAAGAATVRDYSGAVAKAREETRNYTASSREAETVDRARLEQAEQHASSLKAQADALKATAQAERNRLAVLKSALTRGQERLNQAREYLRQLLLSKTATDEEIEAAKNRVAALEDQIEASRIAVQEQQKVAQAAEQAANAFDKEAASAKRASDSLKEVASSGKKASTTVSGSMINHAVLAFRELENISRSAADEIRGMFDYLSQEKEIPEVDLSNLESVDAKLNELAVRVVEADATLRDRWSHFTGIHSGLAHSMNKMYRALHDQEVAALNVMRSILTEARQVEDLRRQIEGLDQASGNAYQTALASVSLFNDQASASAGAIIDLIDQSERAIDSVQYLDDSDLAGLQQGIERAKDRLVELVSQAYAAVEALEGVNRTLQDQIDQEQGNLEALEERRHADQLARIQELYSQSNGLGEEEHLRAFELAEQLHQIKLRQIRERRAQELASAQDTHDQAMDNLEELSRASSDSDSESLPGFNRGGALGGYGGGDRIRALLEAGEFVIRKEAVRKYGRGLFTSLNAMRLPSVRDWAPQVRARLGGFISNIKIPLPSIEPLRLATGGDVRGPAASIPSRVVEVRLSHESAGLSATVYSEEGQVDRLLGILESAGARA